MHTCILIVNIYLFNTGWYITEIHVRDNYQIKIKGDWIYMRISDKFTIIHAQYLEAFRMINQN